MNIYQRYMRKLRAGRKMFPRGMEVNAVYNVSYDFQPGTCWRRPKDNPSIGFAEGLQFIAGIEDLEGIAAVAPNVNLQLFGPTSFYGSRTVGQFDRIVEELKKDADTRRATVMVAHHDDTSETLPCTLNMTFFIDEEKKLRSIVNMRSSDAVWGLPYDQIQFGMVQQAVANSLGIPCGICTVNIANAHVYADHPGGTSWVAYEYFLPVCTDWETYVKWSRSLIGLRLNRIDMEQYFMLRQKV